MRRVRLASTIALQALLGTLLLSCSPGTNAESTATAPPNFLVILVDDLGFSDLGLMGSEIRTPNIDALAAQGVVFTNFHVAPACSPTRAMLLTGTDTHPAGLGTMSGDAGGDQNGRPEYAGFMTDRVVTVASLLQEAGYHTAMAGKWHLGAEPESSPPARGFDQSFGVLAGGASHFSDQVSMFGGGTTPYHEGTEEVSLPADFFGSKNYTDKLIEYIGTAVSAEKPFFAYAAYTAPHWPLQVPDEDLDLYEGTYDEGYDLLRSRRVQNLIDRGVVPEVTVPDRLPWVPAWESLTEDDRRIEARRMELFAAMVENLDRNIGRLIDYLRETGELQNTFIVLSSDNGAEGNNIGTMFDNEDVLPERFDLSYENMGQLDSYVWTGPGWAQAQTAPLHLFKSFTSEGGIRTPAIMVHPDRIRRTGFVEPFASIADVAPTILDMAGVEHPSTFRGRPVVAMQGRSLVPFLSGQAADVHGVEPVMGWELFGRRGIYKGGWKLVWIWEPYGSARWELYNLASDPSESRDLSEVEPAKLIEMLAAWDDYVARNGVVLPPVDMGYGLLDGGR